MLFEGGLETKGADNVILVVHESDNGFGASDIDT